MGLPFENNTRDIDRRVAFAVNQSTSLIGKPAMVAALVRTIHRKSVHFRG